jgi:tetratricopeptide (TPR) repeat protein
MTDRNVKQEIHIGRNPIESFLMRVKDFLRKNKKQVFIVFAAVGSASVITISIFIYLENYSTKYLVKYEEIIENYRQNPLDETVKKQTIDDLNLIIEDTSFGFAPKGANYILGNIYFEDKKFEESYKHFQAYVKKTSLKDVLHPLALNKSAIALEELGRVDEALSVLVKYEEKAKDSIVMDQVLYNIGRLYALSGDRLKARDYFNRLMLVYPDSSYSDRAKERLFLLSVKQG